MSSQTVLSMLLPFLVLLRSDSSGVADVMGSRGDTNTELTNSNKSDSGYIETNGKWSGIPDNKTLYMILAPVLGAMVLVLIILVAICGFKQRQQQRTMLGE